MGKKNLNINKITMNKSANNMGKKAFPRFSHEDDHRHHKEQYSALHPRDKNQRNPITLFKLNLMALFELSSLSSFFNYIGCK